MVKQECPFTTYFLTISVDPSFNNVHHLLKDLTANSPDALGEVRLKVKLGTAADFKSLAPDKIENIYILLQLKD